MRRKCALPDNFRMEAVCKMPVREIKVRVPGGWGGFSWEQTRQAWIDGMKIWSKVIDIAVSVEQDPVPTHVAPTFARIDGMGNVLAWSEFPCPWQPPVLQKYDSSERYHLEVGEAAGTSLPILIAHEMGHALGIGHGPTGNLMAPYLDDSINKLGDWDIKEALVRYDPAPTQPPEAFDWPTLIALIMEFILKIIQLLGKGKYEGSWSQTSGDLSWILRIKEK